MSFSILSNFLHGFLMHNISSCEIVSLDQDMNFTSYMCAFFVLQVLFYLFIHACGEVVKRVKYTHIFILLMILNSLGFLCLGQDY